MIAVTAIKKRMSFVCFIVRNSIYDSANSKTRDDIIY